MELALHQGAGPTRGGTGDARQGTERLRSARDEVGTAERGQSGDGLSENGADVFARRLDARRTGRIADEEVAGDPTRSERHRERQLRMLVRAHRQLERAAADVEIEDRAHSPAEPASHGQEGRRGFGGSAEFLQAHAGLGVYPAQYRLAVAGLADRGGGEGQEVLRLVLRGERPRLRDEVDQLALALLVDVALRVQVGHQLQPALVRTVGNRSGTGMRVEQEQMNSVRTDVEYAEPHVPRLGHRATQPGRRHPRDAPERAKPPAARGCLARCRGFQADAGMRSGT